MTSASSATAAWAARARNGTPPNPVVHVPGADQHVPSSIYPCWPLSSGSQLRQLPAIDIDVEHRFEARRFQAELCCDAAVPLRHSSAVAGPAMSPSFVKYRKTSFAGTALERRKCR